MRVNFLHVFCSFLFIGLVQCGPCDVFNLFETPCVAAHSMVRALYDGYSGSLYQVMRVDTKQVLDIEVLWTGGYANTTAQDLFCDGKCTVNRIYDQSPMKNHLDIAPTGGSAPSKDNPVNASREIFSVGGHRVYGAVFEGKMGYRNLATKGVAKGNDPETIYMVVSGKHYNDQCCFDYGNAEDTIVDDGPGTMESIYWGNLSYTGHGAGVGPWIMADLEDGLWAGNEVVNNNASTISAEFVFAMIKGRSDGFAIKGGDANVFGPITVLYDGPRPSGYQPMKKQGSIILGIGGDNSNGGIGTFFEGCITSGYSTNQADDAVFANIVATGYGK